MCRLLVILGWGPWLPVFTVSACGSSIKVGTDGSPIWTHPCFFPVTLWVFEHLSISCSRICSP